MISFRLSHEFHPFFPTRLLSSVITKQQSHETNKNNETISKKFPTHKIIYSFPYIRVAKAVSILKRHITIYSAASIPISILLNHMNFIEDSTPLAITLTGFVISQWVHIICIPINNMIGFVYSKQTENEVIISYLDYWGRRVDKKVKIKDILPLSDTPINIAKRVYRNVHVKSCKQTLKLFILMGNVLDEEDFKYIFGSKIE